MIRIDASARGQISTRFVASHWSYLNSCTGPSTPNIYRYGYKVTKLVSHSSALQCLAAASPDTHRAPRAAPRPIPSRHARLPSKGARPLRCQATVADIDVEKCARLLLEVASPTNKQYTVCARALHQAHPPAMRNDAQHLACYSSSSCGHHPH